MSKDTKPKAKKVVLVLCSWAGASEGSNLRCGWRGHAYKYQAHLDAMHGGKEYKEPVTGLPAQGD